MVARPRARTADPLGTFSVLWAIATLAHQGAYPGTLFIPSGALASLAALWILARPGSTAALLTLAGVTTAKVVVAGPASVSNHWALASVVSLAFLLHGAALVLRTQRAWPLDRDALFRAFAPTGRVLMLVLYFYAVVHKLNLDYFEPGWSCATNHYASISRTFPILPQHPMVLQATIWGSLAVETLIPILIVLRRTRVVGILLAMLFHLMLAFNLDATFFDFSSVVYALFFLYFPADFVRAAFPRWRAPVGVRRAWQAACAALAAAIVVGALSGAARMSPDAYEQLQERLRYTWILGALGLIAIYVRAVRRRDLSAELELGSRLRLARWAWALPVLLFLHGATPYLGLKTESSFSMFSNLRTEGERWNHALIPPAVKVWDGLQDDLVTVRASSDPRLARLAAVGERYPYFTFRSLTAPARDASLTYERGGQVRTLARIGDDPELSTEPPRWQRWYLRFRPVPPVGQRTSCRH